MKTPVIITQTKDINMRQDYVALPKNYGSREYYDREDVKEIFRVVYENLDNLDKESGYSEKFSSCEKILVKPNLVSVYHNSGMESVDYPESTDPRVFDAVISYLKKFNKPIIITESSGKPMPTRNSFKNAGYDRIAKHQGVGLVALETKPVVRYMLPKAEVMKEVYIPELYQDIVDGKACYVSVPKLKTNIYTGVTLGFKNAMGTIPYALRERNHNYYINKKLADLLYLFKPDLIIIDGIIGGEGNTPAPVDPVDTHVLISGVNSVATDRVATEIMGIDPDTIPLITEAEKRGFGEDEISVVGNKPVFSFRRATPTLMDDDFVKTFPNVLTLVGHNLPHAIQVKSLDEVTPDVVRELEKTCNGGCVNALRSGFEYIIYAQKKKYTNTVVIIVGGGVEIEGKRYWFDRDGKAYEESEIRAMKKPILTLGNCAEVLKDAASFKAAGCCSPSSCMLAATGAMGVTFPLLSLRNKTFVHFGLSAVLMIGERIIATLKGKYVDCPSEHIDKIYGIPDLSEADAAKDYIYWPLPKMNGKTKSKLIKDNLKIANLKPYK
ncbi:MAG: DUF362 domain-containing protein [Clostridia bacterium]|nr:DUF362 domain-containing protein [Clostridia bacterium]